MGAGGALISAYVCLSRRLFLVVCVVVGTLLGGTASSRTRRMFMCVPNVSNFRRRKEERYEDQRRTCCAFDLRLNPLGPAFVQE